MTLYNVHIYREMRLYFPYIEADTPEAAAMIARDGRTEDAEDIEDCNGENLGALIEIVGDDDKEQSLFIDFDAERLRKAASALLAALEAVLPYAENENASLYECWKRDGHAALKEGSDTCTTAIEQARTAIAKATTGHADRRPS
jgi:hypothetical protein